MTKQESFKRRVRERMATTGERYAEARRVLIEKSSPPARPWVSPPEMSDDAVRAKTGHGWDHWCDVIEQWPGHQDGHAAVAVYLEAEQGLDGWWSQTVTVGWERITGVRLPHQRADGTFTANKSRTVSLDAAMLRALLLDDEGRADLFPGEPTELRSKPTSKTIRLGIGSGRAEISATALDDGRCKVTIQHTGLPEYADVERWKFYWSDWLDALEQN